MSKKVKICLAASAGGHYEQLLMLKPLLEKYDGFILTEKTDYKIQSSDGTRVYYLCQVNRKEKTLWLKMIWNAILSMGVLIKERPQVIICTGVLATIPMCLLVKFFGGKLVYIESYAKLYTPTETGKLLYKYADRFFVQWESMKKVYPKAECLGGIY